MEPHVRTVDALEKALMRHVVAVRGAVPPEFVPFALAQTPVGWVSPAVAEAAVALGARAEKGVTLTDPAALAALAGRLAVRGMGRVRGELFDVRDEAGRVLTTIDRGALPVLGLRALGVHVNGLVRRPDGLHIWVGVRSADRPMDPGKLDHLAAGGVAAGDDVGSTLVKEAGEEAGIPHGLARTARAVSVLRYTMLRDEGLRRDELHCFDLDLPEDFVPRPADGEQAGFALWPAARVLDTLAAGDAFKFNVALVLIDLFLREGLLRWAALAEALGAVPARTSRNHTPS